MMQDKTYKLVIVEDEPAEVKAIEQLLEREFPNLTIVGDADNTREAIEIIKKENPDIAIFDISLKDGQSFKILEELDKVNFQVIWLTAHEQFAIRAFRLSAVDYLLKPYNEDDLISSLRKATASVDYEHHVKKLETLTQHLGAGEKKQIVLHTSEAFHVLNISDIIRCQADDNYTHFILSDGEKIIVSKPLKNYEELLHAFDFCRIHQSHLINLHHLKRFVKRRNPFVMLSNEDKIPVSKKMRSHLIRYLDELAD